MKTITKISLIVALIFLAITVFPVFANSEPVSPPPQNSWVQEQTNKLLREYQRALAYELQHGETTTIKDPRKGYVKILTGASAAKLQALWRETQRRIDALTARPSRDREKAIHLIQTLDSGTIRYLYHSKMPYYDAKAEVEVYKSDRFQYTVDIGTGQIIEIAPLHQMRQYSLEPAYSRTELEEKAREFIAKVAKVNLDALTPAFGDKEGKTFFFRWEASGQKLSSGMTPFIQVGFSRGGEFLNYVNTLPFVQKLPSAKSSIQSSYGFSEIYANGGSYWDQTGNMKEVKNAGYCYFAGWCSPKNFLYARGAYPANAIGRWYPNPNSNVKAAAFIPSTNATDYAKYDVYSTGYYNWWYINQSIWYNTWVTITQEGPVPDIWLIKLTNQNANAVPKTAWDEVWVYNP